MNPSFGWAITTESGCHIIRYHRPDTSETNPKCLDSFERAKGGSRFCPSCGNECAATHFVDDEEVSRG